MSELLNSKGFNDWADGYDRSTARSDEDGSYPFAGYNDILNEIFRRITERGAKDVLDIGFGTGVLTARLYAHDCRIFGQDFSEQSGDRWDDAEIYFVYDELKAAFPDLRFDRLSPCAGILSQQKK